MNRKSRRAAGNPVPRTSNHPMSAGVAAFLDGAAAQYSAALRQHQLGRLSDAEGLCRQILAADPNHVESLHLLGVIAHQIGRSDIAVGLITKAIALNDRIPNFHANLGEALRATGQLEAAIERYARALALNPDYAEAHSNLGNAFQQQGKLDEAVACYERALALKPNLAEAHNNLGNALSEQGKLADAVLHYERTLALRPDFAEAQNNLGNSLKQQGKLAEAVARYKRALASRPNYAEAHNNLGNALKLLGNLADSVTHYERALALKPDFAEAQNNLGNALREQGKLAEAVIRYKRALALKPDYAEAHKNLGSVLQEQGKPAEALAPYERALALKPDLKATLSELSTTHLALGSVQAACEALRRQLALDPENVGIYRQLSGLDPGSLSPSETSWLEATAIDHGTSKTHAANACFALAQVYEARGDFDRGFIYLRRANDLQQEFLMEIDGKSRNQAAPLFGEDPPFIAPAKMLTKIAQATSLIELVFSGSFLKQYAGLGHPSNLPVFIVGMPRSGSTLIEQILSSHPLVHGAGEIDAVGKCLAGVRWPYECRLERGADRAFRPNPPPKPPQRYFRELGADYAKLLRGHSRQAQRIVNKMPSNYMHIGMISLCLRNAVIIHSVRDPVDTCLSCYKQLFFVGNETTYDLSLIGRHYVLYRRLMEHWHRALPGQIVDVVHEQLVADPETEIRRIIAACGLPWHDGCLRFHENQRPVHTASYIQVRRPIYKDAIQRWRHYEKHLGPLLDALGPYAPSADPEPRMRQIS